MSRVATAFEGRSAVVTGAAAGIGLALSQALLRLGARVLLIDIDGERLQRQFADFLADGDRAFCLCADVTDAAALQRAARLAAERFGRLDYWFSNAGISGALPIEQASLDHWRRIIDVNLWSVIYGADAVLPLMRRQGGGHLVNVASISGLIPFPGQALYVTGKHAVVGFSESLRHELADQGIAVSVVCPGPVVSDIWGKQIIGEARPAVVPPGAIGADQAAAEILAAVADKAGVIVLPATARRQWRLYRWFPRLADRLLRAFARLQRRSKPTPDRVGAAPAVRE